MGFIFLKKKLTTEACILHSLEATAEVNVLALCVDSEIGFSAEKKNGNKKEFSKKWVCMLMI